MATVRSPADDQEGARVDSRLVVGCPVRRRDWVLDKWREHVIWACYKAGMPHPTFVFVQGEDEDPIDWDDAVVVSVPEIAREDVRTWDTERFVHMVNLRNTLLKKVRELRPDFFWSLDSDILANGDSLWGMLETFSSRPQAWAVGSKLYMTTVGVNFPSYGTWTSRDHRIGFKREERSDVFKVGVLMASVLMAPKAYKTDYQFHHWGEDAGWSDRVAALGGELWWDGRYPSKHVMSPDLLGAVDKRVGY